MKSFMGYDMRELIELERAYMMLEDYGCLTAGNQKDYVNLLHTMVDKREVIRREIAKSEDKSKG